MSIRDVLKFQSNWSERVFGPVRPGFHEGICKHIEEELAEIREEPRKLDEWMDVAILAFDGAWRAGYTPEQIWEAYLLKMMKNMSRVWPDWRDVPSGLPINHVKGTHD